jgi:hypothetical protein
MEINLSVTAKKNSRDFIAASVESLSPIYFPSDRLRFCTSAADENQ